MTDPAVPERVRRVLNAESGLNGGLATPVVTVAIAGAAAAESAQGASPGGALIDLVTGRAVEIVVGLVCGQRCGGPVGGDRLRPSRTCRPMPRTGWWR